MLNIRLNFIMAGPHQLYGLTQTRPASTNIFICMYAKCMYVCMCMLCINCAPQPVSDKNSNEKSLYDNF